MTWARDKENILSPRQESNPGPCSSCLLVAHWIEGPPGVPGLNFFSCFPTLVSCWWVHFSHFITERKIHFLAIFIYRYSWWLRSADPSNMQNACHIWTPLNDPTLHEFSWFSGSVERPPGVREVMDLIPVEDSDFFFVPRSCHVQDQFTFHISLPSSKCTIFIHWSLLMMTSVVLILAICRKPVTYKFS